MQRISDTSSIRITWPGIRYSIVGCHSSKFPSVIKVKQKTNYLFKGILSTKIVICSYPKLLLFSVLTFIKWRLTLSYAAKDTIFWQKKTQNYRYQNYCRMTIFKSIHMTFYVNPSWACTLFRNNKQHVVLGQKRKCQLVE